MRVPAISFDPVASAPPGVARLQASASASRTAVSPDGGGAGGSRYQRAARDAEQPAPEPAAAPSPQVDAGPPAPALPTYYPPLNEQRAVLDRPAPEAGDAVPVVPVQREEAPAEPRSRPPVAGSPIDDALRRIIGAV